MDITQHKAQLRQYFDGVGFKRWSAIYGKGRLSGVRQAIRSGHTAMLALAGSWLSARYPQPDGLGALDVGCGTGLFSLDLARRGFTVTAADLAPQMVAATQAAAAEAGLDQRLTCRVSDLEDLDGAFPLVACFDVLIHYPSAPFVVMLRHLAQLSTGTLIFTYAPYSPLLAALHRIGGYFPHSQRRTEIQMIRAELVAQTLAQAGMRINRSQRVGQSFYHVTLVEAVRI